MARVAGAIKIKNLYHFIAARKNIQQNMNELIVAINYFLNLFFKMCQFTGICYLMCFLILLG